MITKPERKIQGVRALAAALGEVGAERFVSLLTREPFDYTQWQVGLWPDLDVDQLGHQAMRLREATASK